MIWTTPILVEICIGLEINGYTAAPSSDLDPIARQWAGSPPRAQVGGRLGYYEPRSGPRLALSTLQGLVRPQRKVAEDRLFGRHCRLYLVHRF